MQHQMRQTGSCFAIAETPMPAVAITKPPQAVRKDLYEIGEVPPLGHVPARMHAWAIRKERHGPPETSMQLEVLPTWPIGDDEVLVYVMAGGVNYNGVWAGLGVPISPLDVHKNPFHIAGSDAAGIVWACGSKVRRWKVGDEVVIHCNQDDGDDEECNGGDPLLSASQRIWGYETPDGSFAQFCRVQSRQLMPKPAHLTWEEAACYTLTLATAYRMLYGHPRHARLRYLGEGGAQVRQGGLGHHRQAGRRYRVRASRRGDVPSLLFDREARWHGCVLRRHLGLQHHLRRALRVDAAETRAGLAFRPPQAGLGGQPVRARPPHRPLHEPGISLDEDTARARIDANQPAPAGQHGSAGQHATRGAAHVGRCDRGGGNPIGGIAFPPLATRMAPFLL